MKLILSVWSLNHWNEFCLSDIYCKAGDLTFLVLNLGNTVDWLSSLITCGCGFFIDSVPSVYEYLDLLRLFSLLFIYLKKIISFSKIVFFCSICSICSAFLLSYFIWIANCRKDAIDFHKKIVFILTLILNILLCAIYWMSR